MADRNDGSPSLTDRRGAAGRVDAAGGLDGGRAGNVVSEFMDAARSAAESLLDEQKREVADRVSGVADALRNAVHPLHQSQNRIIARYVAQAADRVGSFAHRMRERRWNELIVDTEEFARRQPTWFVLGAVATGFLVGRFLWVSTAERQHVRPPATGESSRFVRAAVSSGSGAVIDPMVGDSASSTGTVEAR